MIKIIGGSGFIGTRLSNRLTKNKKNSRVRALLLTNN